MKLNQNKVLEERFSTTANFFSASPEVHQVGVEKK